MQYVTDETLGALLFWTFKGSFNYHFFWGNIALNFEYKYENPFNNIRGME